MAAPSKRKRRVNIAVSNMEKRLEEQKKEFAESCANLEAQFEEDNRLEKIELHNRFAAIIEEMNAAPENVLLVFELLKHEVADHLISRMAESQKAPPTSKISATDQGDLDDREVREANS